ncbi:MAG: hypothetical protein GC187_05865 [Alphaproteobacteria bacterium]|nr:hypothetical protein [Alphaproteobacteria bacterium]
MPNRNFLLSICLAPLCALGVSAPSLAQGFTGAPVYGELDYTPGAEPVSLRVRAAGAMSADRLSPDCWGYISEQPTVSVVLRARGNVRFAAGSDTDTTLAVRAPDGTITCDDDGANAGYNPGVALDNAPSGRYDVWLGTFSAGVGYPDAVFHVATDAFITDNPYSVAPSADETPLQTLSLRAGFRGDPRSISVVAGGAGDMSSLDWSCYGGASRAAALALDYQAGSLPLYIFMRSQNDGTLAVLAPDGTFHCNDDRIELNPGVAFGQPQSGRYLIWTGLLDNTLPAEAASLVISEIGFDGVDNRLDVAGRPRHGERRLQGGFLPDPVAVSVMAGGTVDLNLATEGGVIADGWCVGMATREPSFRLRFDDPAGPLFFSLASDADTTLAVNSPDGAWYCNDDMIGLDPVVRFNQAEAGVYDVYAGSFGGETAAATLYISEIGGGADPVSSQVDINAEPLFGAVTLAAGFLPDPHDLDVAAGGPIAAYDAIYGEDLWCAGHITREPTANLFWEGQGGPLYIWAESGADTTIAINLPDGSWACDDDFAGNLNPGLVFDSALSGRYDIYVGTYGQGMEGEPARLRISELTPDWASWE